jgi:DNA-binding GntR family transcriptional regulator
MSKRAEAYEAIRDRILRDEAPFEKRTSERAIAEQYVKMSRTPVREALAVLEGTGVVDQIPQVGVEVHQTGPAEALQALDLRIGMESVIVEELAGRDGLDLGTLDNTMKAMESARSSGDRIEFMLADTRFHKELTQLGGFHTSVTALQGLRDRVHLLRLRQPLSEEQMGEILDEHAALVGAINADDPVRAGEEIRSHLGAAKARIEEVNPAELRDELEPAFRREPAVSEG